MLSQPPADISKTSIPAVCARTEYTSKPGQQFRPSGKEVYCTHLHRKCERDMSSHDNASSKINSLSSLIKIIVVLTYSFNSSLKGGQE